MSEAVLADPQFGIIRTLRPFDTFATVYQGVSALTPINLSEEGIALDPQAGKTGYDPRLIKAVEVPLGSRVIMWLPQVGFVESVGPPVLGPYRFQFLWRLRNTFDYRQTRQPYHFPKQAQGVEDTTPVTGGARVVIPAANNTTTYIQPEPAGALARAIQNVRSEDLNFGAVNNLSPLLPDGSTGVIQQGLADPVAIPSAIAPFYQVHEIQVLGDELLISVLRDDSVEANWDFTGTADALFNTLFSAGNDIGVYVTVGTAP